MKFIFLMFLVNLSWANTSFETKFLRENDAIYCSEKSAEYVLPPYVKISLRKGAKIHVKKSPGSEPGKEISQDYLIELKRGHAKFEISEVKSEQHTVRIKSKDVIFASQFGVFEVSNTKKSTVLKVSSGDVEVSSPFINSFVPVVIKGGEGFLFSNKNKTFKLTNN